jgi:hypothetical protein
MVQSSVAIKTNEPRVTKRLHVSLRAASVTVLLLEFGNDVEENHVINHQ